MNHRGRRSPRLLVLMAMLSVLATSRAVRAQAVSCEPARTALVLGGGGAKGFAHLGLLKALDSLGVVPDLVVGTSIGAILGALYASGETGDAIDTLMRHFPLNRVIRDYDPVVSASLGGLRPIVVWEREPARWVLQTGTAREGEVSALISEMMLQPNLLARGRFDSLPIPFRAVATALDGRAVVPLDSGDLAQAVRASMSLPLLLRPVVIDGRALIDGGLSSNVPVGVARALGAQRVIVSTTASPRPDPAAFDDPLTVTGALFEYLWVQDSLRLGVEDVLVAHPTADFGNLDFRPATIDSLVRIGRRTADAALARGACLRPLSTSRRVISAPVAIGRARVATGDVRDRDAILREVALLPRTPLDQGAIALGLSRFARIERYRGLWLHPSGDSDRVDFDLTIDPAPRKSFGLGVAFDHTMSGRIWMGGIDRSLFDRDLEGAAVFAAGTYRNDLTLAARRRARVSRRYLPVGGSLEFATERVRLYQGAAELPSAATEEITALIGVRPLFEPGWSYELSGDYRLWREPGQPTRGTAGVRYAVRLRRPGAPDPAITLEAIGLQAWQRARLDLSLTDTLGALEIRPRIRVGWGRRLPVQQTFTLGGLEGFAGLRMLEQRGDRELYGSLLFRWPAFRRVFARVEPMIGVTGTGSFLTRTGPTDGLVLVGGRIGVELDTPAGPIRIEQGFNNQNRRQALIRVGHWF